MERKALARNLRRQGIRLGVPSLAEAEREYGETGVHPDKPHIIGTARMVSRAILVMAEMARLNVDDAIFAKIPADPQEIGGFIKRLDRTKKGLFRRAVRRNRRFEELRIEFRQRKCFSVRELRLRRIRKRREGAVDSRRSDRTRRWQRRRNDRLRRALGHREQIVRGDPVALRSQKLAPLAFLNQNNRLVSSVIGNDEAGRSRFD